MVDLLRQWYPIYATRVVAGALDVPVAAVYQKAQRLGLGKSPDFLASTASGRLGRHNVGGVSTRFAKGQVPWNKGTHFVSGGRSAETRFKPGQKPRSWLPVGSYRIVPDGILELKVNDLPGPNHIRWHPVHRLVWIKAHGPVPPGHLVVFKPGRRTSVLEEITLDRIECISRADNARRNHPRSKSPELARLVQLKGAITRQVNRIVREHEEREGTQ
jgi:hypothetical protein